MSYNYDQHMYHRGDDEPRFSTTTRRGNNNPTTTQRRKKGGYQNAQNAAHQQHTQQTQMSQTSQNVQNQQYQPSQYGNTNQNMPQMQNTQNIQSVPYMSTPQQPQQYPTYQQQPQYYQYTPEIRQISPNGNQMNGNYIQNGNYQPQFAGQQIQQINQITPQYNNVNTPNQMNPNQQQFNQIREVQQMPQIQQMSQIREVQPGQQNIQQIQQKPIQPQPCCYCESTHGIVQCADCNKFICNGPIFNSTDCQILTHIRLCSHTNIKVNGNLIECSECKDSNVFNLRYSMKSKRIVCHTCLNRVVRTEEDKVEYNTTIIDEGHFDLTFFDIKSSSIPVKKEVLVLAERNNESKEKQGNTSKRKFKTPKDVYESSKEYFDVYQPLFGLEEIQQRKIEEGDYKITEQEERCKFIQDEKGQLKLEITTKYVMKGLTKDTDFLICLDGKHNIIDINDLEAIYNKQSKGKFDECAKVFFGKVDSWNDRKVKINLIENYFLDMRTDMRLQRKQMYDGFISNKQYKIVRWYCIFNPNKPYNQTIKGIFDSLEKTSYGRSLLGTLHPPEEFFEGGDLTYEIRLNTSQKKAVLRALNNQVSVIFGPPGSGKTSTIVSIALNYLKHFDDIVDLESVAFEMDTNLPIQPKVLTCAPSNAAVNILAAKLEEFNLRVCRLVSIEKLDDLEEYLWNQCVYNWALNYANEHPELSHEFTFSLKSWTKGNQKGQRPRYQMVTSKPHNVHEYLKELKTRKFQRNVIDMEREKRSVIEKFISRHFAGIIEDSNCVCCSTKACNKKYFEGIRFVCTIMDEATQAVELDTLIPAMRSTRLVLVGDLQQLNSIILSKEASRIGYGKSMFERLLNCNVTRTTLREQYRMHPSISKLINAMFYDKMLIDKTPKKTSEISLFPNKQCPFVFICHRGKERYSGRGSVFNDTEVEIVKKVLHILINENGINQKQIGVISPYVAQKEEIGFEGTSSSVDGFQGSEKEYVILSTVRSNQTKGAGFVGEYRRINVALSRAKHGLIVVGNEMTLGMSPVWKKVLNYLSKQNSILMYENGEFKAFNYLTSSDDNYEESEYKCFFLNDN